jgi:hypothetical protein
MPKKKTFNFRSIINTEGKLFGKFDLFLPLFLIIAIVLALFIGKVLLQKDEYVEAELFASGGEWWWDNPEPPYWLADPIVPGAKEYDPQGNVLVEVLDVKKFEVGDRKMLWMKVKLRVTPADKSKQFRFRREPLQVGSVVYISPNNVRVFCNVMWVQGTDTDREESEKIVTLKEYDVFPWLTEQIQVGDTMKDDSGTVLAEVLEKREELAEVTTNDINGNVLVKRNPLRRDITLRIKLKTTKSRNIEYFSYFQPLKVGFYIWLPFSKVNISGNLISIE